MQIQVLALSCLVVALTACQSSDALHLNSNRPLGQASMTGTTPLFNANPTGATAQLTDAEKANIRTDLQASTSAAATQAAADNAGIYQRDVSALKAGGNTLTAQRLKRIQATAGSKDNADATTFQQDSAALTEERLKRITGDGGEKPETPAEQ